jgi:hypothetical protein
MEATEQDIYDQAIGEQVENTPETPVEAPTEAKAERVRDEKGRFAPATQEAPETVAVDQGAQPPVESAATEGGKESQEGARVPSWRLAEESQRRRDAEQALNDLRNEMRQIQMQIQMQNRPMQQQEAAPEVDIFADPQGFVQTIRSEYQRELQALRLENSLERADQRHGDVFRRAYDAFTNHITNTRDQATYQRVMMSGDPGKSLVDWYNHEELSKQLGGSDLQSFLEKQKQEWMKDPAYQAQVIEAFKATQQAQPTTKVTNLPPSLSKAPAGQSAHDGTINSMADVYKYATGR